MTQLPLPFVTDTSDGVAEPYSTHALRVIEGENAARQLIARLQAQQADPDELALILALLGNTALHGFYRVIAKVLGASHA